MSFLRAPSSRWALSAAFACWAMHGPVGAEPVQSYDFDSTKAYAHLGLGYPLSSLKPNPSAQPGPGEGGEFAGQILLQAHAFRLLGRLGVAASLLHQPRGAGTTNSSHRIEYYGFDWSEASLRLRFGAADDGQGIQIGLMPLSGDPDAIVFGNYLARFAPYEAFGARALRPWDSLGSLSPRVEGARLALGRAGGPMREEAWIVRDGGDFSWFAFLSGTAPRRVEWGLGMSGYRTWTWSNGLAAPGRDPDWILPHPYDTARVDTISLDFTGVSFSIRASLDFASFFRLESPDRYGGLFAEAALLGWEDRPVIAPRRSRRIAWTAGARLPTFGWLDACVAQWEWRIVPVSDLSAYESGNAISGVPSDYPSGFPSRGPSHWNAGLLLRKRFGARFEAQARALSEVEPKGWRTFGILPAQVSRQDLLLGRLIFRLP